MEVDGDSAQDVLDRQGKVKEEYPVVFHTDLIKAFYNVSADYSDTVNCGVVAFC